jgi:integrase
MGTVRKRGKGYQLDYRDPTGKRVRQTFKLKKEAKAELAKREALIAENRYLDVRKSYTTRLKDLTDTYIENHEHQPSFKSQKCYAIDHILEYFGPETLLVRITYRELETYRNYLRNLLTKHDTPRKPATVNRQMATLRHIMRKALAWDMIDVNPFDKGESLQLTENNQRLRFLSEEEVERLLTECPLYLRDIVICAVNTGMRKSELLNLKWTQIRSGQIYLTETKTDKPRQIPVNGTLQALFKTIRKKWGTKNEQVFLYDGSTVVVFKEKVRIRQPKKVCPVPVIDIKHAFRAAVKRAGIDDFRFHDLRHTFASHLVMNGASLKVVQELLGHADIKMTMRYSHLSPEHKQQAVCLLDGLTPQKNLPWSQMVTKVDFHQRERVRQNSLTL